MSWGVSPWVYPVWDSLGFLDLGGYFLSHFTEVCNYYLKYFLMAFLFFFFWDSYDSNVGVFNIVPEVSDVVLDSYNSLFLFSSLIHLFLPFYLLLHLSYLLLSYSTVGSLQSAFYLSYCIIHYWLTLFFSSRFLLNISCIFSVLEKYLSITPFCFQNLESFLFLYIFLNFII